MIQRPLLPQRATDERVEVDSVEWLFEPAWPGERLIAHIRDGDVRLTDADGRPIEHLPDAEALLSRAVRASRAILDGTWTRHPVVDEEGTTAERDAYVALDLLELEGEPLLDVPLLERRRLLDSVLEEGLQVRVSPMVKQPVGGWLAGWRRAGFTHYLARHQNGRYHPGEQSNDWLLVPLESPPTPGLLRRVMGGGEPKARRIRD